MTKFAIPTSLWDNGALHVPPVLLDAYRRSLLARNLWDVMLNDSGGAVGGATSAAFMHHYATRFRVGACRMLGAALDPEEAFGSLSADLLTTFSAGRICVLDIPSGPCTASLALLSAIVELRARLVLPTLPLNIDLHAADASPDALEVADELLRSVQSALAERGIAVKLYPHRWDASSVPETTVLMDRVHQLSQNPSEYLAITANFSGTAGHKDLNVARQRYDDFGPALEIIQSRLITRSTFLWLEPRSPAAKQLLSLFSAAIKRMFKSNALAERTDHEYKWFDSFGNKQWACTLLVQRYERK